MKKNIPMRIASILLTAVLITSGAVSGTFAKYTAEATAEDSVDIAKWSFTTEGTDIAKATTFTFGLFDTIKNTGEKNVTKGKIAPGTSGSFTIDLKNASEVTAKYTITLSAMSNPTNIPIEFSTNGSTWTTRDKINVTNNNFAINATTQVTIHWRWAFGNSTEVNKVDTDAGTNTAANRKLSVTAKIVAEQVD